MKLSKFISSSFSSLKNFVREKAEDVGLVKRTHLSYQRLRSRFAGVRYGAQASAASLKRSVRNQAAELFQRNKRGCPKGLRRPAMRLCDARRLPKVLRYNPDKKVWERVTSMSAQAVIDYHEAMKNGETVRRMRHVATTAPREPEHDSKEWTRPASRRMRRYLAAFPEAVNV